eukprot:3600589-Rhodomonas_salina.1
MCSLQFRLPPKHFKLAFKLLNSGATGSRAVTASARDAEGHAVQDEKEVGVTGRGEGQVQGHAR